MSYELSAGVEASSGRDGISGHRQPSPAPQVGELVAAGASGDLAYTVGYEHITFSMDGGPVQATTLRVTHIYRREDGEWRTVHRHADVPPTRPLRSADASTE